MLIFNNRSKPKTKEGKDKKRNTFGSVNALYKGQELTLNTFKSEIFPIQATQGKGRPSDIARVATVFERTRLKVLTPKQMLHRLLIALAQIKRR